MNPNERKAYTATYNGQKVKVLGLAYISIKGTVYLLENGWWVTDEDLDSLMWERVQIIDTDEPLDAAPVP